MRLVLLVGTALVAACSSGAERQAEQESEIVASSEAEPDLPTTPPDGSPLTEGYCLEQSGDPDSPFGNAKECFYRACDMGDEASCEMARSYNGNMSGE